jgi:ADP-glucose pyrophosphorylase
MNMAKDGTNRGGARIGSGQKKKALADKILDGNPGNRKLTIMDFTDMTELTGESMPKPRGYLTAKQKDGSTTLAAEIFNNTWQWLKERGCAQLVTTQLIEQYAQSVARWIQCEQAISEFGFLAKHPTTGNAYFKHSMDLLDWDIRNDLFFKNGPIHTKVKDEVPAKYGVDAVAKNSLVADGCIVEGTIENCILFRGVRIAKGAVVRNSIIMQKCEVQEQALIENVILDKDVIVRRGKRLIGQDSYPIVIGKKIII